jgi:hypothetical protein
MKDNKLKTYSVDITLGSVGDMESELWTEEDWAKHAKYVEQLKKEGKYGKKETILISLIPSETFNTNPIVEPIISHSFIYLDHSI